MATGTLTNAELMKRREAAVPRGPFNVGPIFADRAEGALLWDVEGHEYIDFCGGIGVVNSGHNHPAVVDAVKRQADRFIHTCWHVAMYDEYLRLAERLNELVPMPGPNKTAFFNSGAEAGENCVKIARAYTGRAGVVSFERGFHGRTLLGMTMTGKVKPYTAGFGPFAPEVYRLPYQPFFSDRPRTDDEVRAECRGALDRLFHYHIEPESIACIIVEPVLGEGGFYPIHPVAFAMLREECTKHGIVLVSDEVQAGFGRCGAMFACERYDIVPDLIAMAKSLGGGMPLSAVTGTAEIMDAPGIGGIGGTYGGNPLACAAANAVLDVMEKEALPERANAIGKKVLSKFRDLQAHDWVGNVRGLGAMCAIEIIDPETKAPDTARAGRITVAAREKGLLVMTASGNVIRTLMPLVITDDQLDRALDILADAIASAG
ncbi:4-aminobutyrate--2-oxoglutarate transaminase [bacterium]|nr:4-aminobutyrate--2-oxoglutarate transaminase [bacterium]